MALDFQAGVPAGTVGTSVLTLTPPLPASVAAGDLLIMAIDQSVDIAVTSISTDPGWTQLFTDTTAADRFRVYTKTAGASESAPTVTFASNALAVICLIRVRGWDTATGPAQVTALVSSTTTASIDPPTAGSAKVGIMHIDPTAGGTITWATATALASQADGASCFVAVAYKMEDTAGALAYTYTGSGAAATLIFSIAPAAAAAAFVPQIVIT